MMATYPKITDTALLALYKEWEDFTKHHRHNGERWYFVNEDGSDQGLSTDEKEKSHDMLMTLLKAVDPDWAFDLALTYSLWGYQGLCEDIYYRDVFDDILEAYQP